MGYKLVKVDYDPFEDDKQKTIKLNGYKFTPVNYDPFGSEPDGALTALKSGAKQTGNMLRTAFNVATRDDEDVQAIAAKPQEVTPSQQRFREDIANRKETQGDQSVWQAVKNVAGAAWDNPKGAFHEVVAQLPNSAAVMAGMGTGAKLGLVATGGNPIGGIVGGVMGMLLGDVAIETGGVAQEQAQKGEYDRGKAILQGAKKGLTIGAVDTATMGGTALMWKPVYRAAGRAAEQAAVKTLTDAGIDVASKSAVMAALQKSPQLVADVRKASAKAATAAMPKGLKSAGLHGVSGGAELLSEGVGEYAGSVMAGLDASLTDAVMESMSSGPSAVVQAGIGKAVAKGQDATGRIMDQLQSKPIADVAKDALSDDKRTAAQAEKLLDDELDRIIQGDMGRVVPSIQAKRDELENAIQGGQWEQEILDQRSAEQAKKQAQKDEQIKQDSRVAAIEKMVSDYKNSPDLKRREQAQREIEGLFSEGTPFNDGLAELEKNIAEYRRIKSIEASELALAERQRRIADPSIAIRERQAQEQAIDDAYWQEQARGIQDQRGREAVRQDLLKRREATRRLLSSTEGNRTDLENYLDIMGQREAANRKPIQPKTEDQTPAPDTLKLIMAARKANDDRIRMAEALDREISDIPDTDQAAWGELQDKAQAEEDYWAAQVEAIKKQRQPKTEDQTPVPDTLKLIMAARKANDDRIRMTDALDREINEVPEVSSGYDIEQNIVLQKLDAMQAEVNNSQSKGVTYNQDGDAVAFSSSSPAWMSQIQKDRKRDGQPALTRKDLNTLFNKARNGQPMTERQLSQWRYVDRALKEYPGEFGEITAQDEAMDLERRGFEIYGGAKLPVADLKQGDTVIGTVDGVKDEFEVKGIDADGDVLLQDGVTKKVHIFDDIQVDGLKRSDGKPVAQAEIQKYVPETDFGKTPQPPENIEGERKPTDKDSLMVDDAANNTPSAADASAPQGVTQPDILTSYGEPFANKAAAAFALKTRKADMTHEPVQVEGGWVGRVIGQERVDKNSGIRYILDENQSKIEDQGGGNDSFITRVDLRKTGQTTVLRRKVESISDAASTLSDLGKKAQEEAYIIATGQDGSIESIHKYSKGTNLSSLVNASQAVGHILKSKKIKSVFFIHNHPGGSVVPSSADIGITKRIRSMLALSGKRLQAGIVSNDKFVEFDESGDTINSGMITPQTGGKTKVPISERMITSREPQNQKQYLSPNDLFVRFKDEGDGILFLNVSNKEIGFMLYPRGKTIKEATVDFIEYIAKTNAASIVINAQHIDSQNTNRGEFYQALIEAKPADVQILDIVTKDKNGAFVSYYESGLMPTSGTKDIDVLNSDDVLFQTLQQQGESGNMNQSAAYRLKAQYQAKQKEKQNGGTLVERRAASERDGRSGKGSIEESAREKFNRLFGRRDSSGQTRLIAPLRKDLRQLKDIVALFGKEAYFFTSKKLNNVNGFTNPANGNEIFINANSTDPLVSVAGHELIHQLKKDHPDLYEFLLNTLRVSDDNFAKYVQDLNRGRDDFQKVTDPERQYEEFIGDFASDQFPKVDFWSRMLDHNAPMTKRIIGILETILNKIRKIFTRAEQYVSNAEESMDALAYAMSEAMRRHEAKIKADVKGGKVNPAFMTQKIADQFYSQMRNFLNLKLTTGPVQNIKAQVEAWAKKGEFKQEELEWSGLLDWLADQKGKVTKQAVMDYLDQNRVVIEDVVKGGDDMGALVREKFDRDFDWDEWLYETKKEEAQIAWEDRTHIVWDSLDKGKNEYKDFEDFQEDVTFLKKEFVFNRVDIEKYIDEAMDVNHEMVSSISEEIENDFDGSEGVTKFSQYQTPGGKNYKELLLTLPVKKNDSFSEWRDEFRKRFGRPPSAHEINDWQNKVGRHYIDKEYRSSHFDAPNILAHIRMNERTGPNGERVLFIEEVQSDWHQEGRKKGYNQKPKVGETFFSKARGIELTRLDDLPQQPSGVIRVRDDRNSEFYVSDNELSKGVPNAPFKKSWPMLAFKRMVRYAAENGFDQIAWTGGEVQADRYDLSKHLDKVSVYRNKHGYSLEAFRKGEELAAIDRPSLSEQDLADTVGKELAEKIVKDLGGADYYTVKHYTGLDLKVGGEGMKGFYDKILPAEVNKFFGKKTWGNAKAQPTDITGIPSWVIPVTPEMRQKALYEGMPMFMFAGPEAATADKSKAFEAQQMRDEGASRKEVWDKTGWWEIIPGSDVWSFELDDSQVDLAGLEKKLQGHNDGGTVYSTIGEVVKADELFSAYPWLKDIDLAITVKKDAGPSGLHQPPVDRSHEGLFDLQQEIKVSAPDIETAKSVLLHEIQHAIQVYEGFARGGTPDKVDVESALQGDKKIDEYQERIDDLAFDGYDFNSPEIDAVRKERDAYVEKTLKDKFGEDFGFGYYQSLTGEAEARLVQKRLKMTAEQRKAEAPWITLKGMLWEEGLLTDLNQNPEDVLQSIYSGPGNNISYSIEKGYQPKKTIKAYKIFRTLKTKPGELFPLFIGKSKPTPVGEWLQAEFLPTKGFAPRPGWHAGISPIAPHLRQTSTGRIKPGRVWAEVEMPADQEWQTIANATETKDIRDRIPENGHYQFTVSQMQGGGWLIGGAIKVNRILSDADVYQLLKEAGYDDAEIRNELQDPDSIPADVKFSTSDDRIKTGVETLNQNQEDVLISRDDSGTMFQVARDAKDIPEDYYNENRKQSKSLKLKVTGTVSKIAREFATEVDRYLGAISTRLANVNPNIAASLREMDFHIGTKSAERAKVATALMTKAKKVMTRDDFADWDVARKNSDMPVLNKLIKKYDLEKEYQAVRQMLDTVRKEAIEVGYDVGEIKEYWPRLLKDQEGFLRAIDQGPERPVFTDALKQKAKAMGINVWELSDDLRADIISNVILGKYYGIPGPGAIKSRVFDVIPAEFLPFYADSDAAIVHHIHIMTKRIEARKFFGKVPEKVAAAKSRLRAAETRMIEAKKSGDTERIESLQDLISEYSAIIEKYKVQNDFTEHIGSYINELISKKKIKPEQERIVKDILTARFNEHGTRGIVQAYKHFSYLDTMGSPISAITQIGDLAWAMYEGGMISALKHAFKSAVGQSRITKEDVGVERIAQEFADNDTLSKALAKVFKWTGLSKMDSIGKESLLNTAFEKYKARAKANPNKLKSDIKHIFEGETDSVIQDLLNDDITDNVKLLVYHRLLDFQPMALSEMPEKYLAAGNGRIFYMLKTFTLKQFDVFRKEVYNDLKKGNAIQKAHAMKRLVSLSALFVLANAGADEIKDWVLGRKTDFEDRAVDNMLRLLGVSKFVTWKARTEGAGTAIARQILPPFQFFDALTKDFYQYGDDKGLEVVKSIPIAGKLAYWHMGKGSHNQQDLWDIRLRKEKARLEKTFERYEKSKNKAEFAMSNIQDLRKQKQVNKLQGRLNVYRKKINNLKSQEQTKDVESRIKSLEEARTKLIKRYFKKE